MSRGRGLGGEEAGLRPVSSPKVDLESLLRQDPLTFRHHWNQLPLLERLEFEWPEDLRYLDLSDLDLMGLDFRGRDLSGSDLRGADLRGCLLDGATLAHANLSCAQFDDNVLGDISLGLGVDPDELIILMEPDHTDYIVNRGGKRLARVYDLRERGYRIEEYYTTEPVQRRRTVHVKTAFKVDENGKSSLLDPDDWYCHRDPAEGPAWEEWHKSGGKKTEKYMVEDELHRIGGPALQGWGKAGAVLMRCFYENGVLHRLGDLPALESWRGNGSKEQREYRVRGKLDRKNGRPAFQEWVKSGELVTENYYEDDLPTRDYNAGAALNKWYEDGSIELFEYQNKGIRHRPRRLGPTVFSRDKRGAVTAAEVWERGKQKKVPNPYKFEIDGIEYEYAPTPRWAGSALDRLVLQRSDTEEQKRRDAHQKRIAEARERKSKKKPKKSGRRQK